MARSDNPLSYFHLEKYEDEASSSSKRTHAKESWNLDGLKQTTRVDRDHYPLKPTDIATRRLIRQNLRAQGSPQSSLRHLPGELTNSYAAVERNNDTSRTSLGPGILSMATQTPTKVYTVLRNIPRKRSKCVCSLQRHLHSPKDKSTSHQTHSYQHQHTCAHPARN